MSRVGAAGFVEYEIARTVIDGPGFVPGTEVAVTVLATVEAGRSVDEDGVASHHLVLRVNDWSGPARQAGPAPARPIGSASLEDVPRDLAGDPVIDTAPYLPREPS